MTGDDIRTARGTLGRAWGLDRPLHCSELGRILRLVGRDPGARVYEWERGHQPVSGPVSVAIDLMLAGAVPRHLREAVTPPHWAKFLTTEQVARKSSTNRRGYPSAKWLKDPEESIM